MKKTILLLTTLFCVAFLYAQNEKKQQNQQLSNEDFFNQAELVFEGNLVKLVHTYNPNGTKRNEDTYGIVVYDVRKVFKGDSSLERKTVFITRKGVGLGGENTIWATPGEIEERAISTPFLEENGIPYVVSTSPAIFFLVTSDYPDDESSKFFFEKKYKLLPNWLDVYGNKAAGLNNLAFKNREELHNYMMQFEGYRIPKPDPLPEKQMDSVMYEMFERSRAIMDSVYKAAMMKDTIPVDKKKVPQEAKSTSDNTLTLQLANKQITQSGGKNYFECDVMATSNNSSIFFSATTFYITYDHNISGSNIVNNGKATVTKGAPFNNSDNYNTFIYDVSPTSLYVNINSNYLSLNRVKLNTTPIVMLHVKIELLSGGDASQFYISFLFPLYEGINSTYALSSTAPTVSDIYYDKTFFNGLIPTITTDLNSITKVAGIGDILTIAGDNFGTYKGSVHFKAANDGGQKYLQGLLGQYIESWCNTQIKVKVPSMVYCGYGDTTYLSAGAAGTGTVKIRTSSGNSCTSSSTLQIPYSITNDTTTMGGAIQVERVYLTKRDCNFDFLFTLSPGFKTHPDLSLMIQAMDAALLHWSELTGLVLKLDKKPDGTPRYADEDWPNMEKKYIISNAGLTEAMGAKNITSKITVNGISYLYCRSGSGIDINTQPELNPKRPFSWAYNISGSVPSGSASFYQAFLHEVGHILLLGHVNNPSELMFYTLPNTYYTNPIITKPALAPTVYAVQQNITASQAIPWPGDIQSNTTWANNNHFLHSVVTVKSGATLTVSGNVCCSQNAALIVEAGAKLIIDGGTLTSGCDDQMWPGITVLGNPSQPLHNTYQGYVELKNGGTIENAICGITATNGGMVKTNSAYFINNKTGVKFEPVALGQSNGESGNFVTTNFILDDNYLGNTSDFEAHLVLESSGSVVVKGCEFSSTATQYGHPNNYGIKSFNSALTVRANCIQVLQLCKTNPSKFNGLNYGIAVENSGNDPVVAVRGTIFTNCKYGVQLRAVNYAEIYLNDFFSTTDFSIGLSITNSTGYQIEGNLFSGGSNPSPNTETIGLMISNSGTFENQVYRNEYTGLYLGQNFRCENSSQSGPYYFGLQSLCNTFSNNQYRDILVGDLGPRIYCHEGNIKQNQGNAQRPAKNLFSQNLSTQFESKSQYSINYYHNPNTNETPLVSGLINNQSTVDQYNCPNFFGIHNKEKSSSPLAQYDEWNEQYEYWLAKLYEVCGQKAEGGNEECEVIRDMVSYYSALKDNYFNAIIVAVMNNDGETQDSYGLTVLRSYGLQESLRYLFSYRGQYQDYLSIVETYLAENNFPEAITTTTQMFEKFRLTENQVSEITALQTYIRWLQQLDEKGGNIYKLPENEIEYLVNYVETRSGRGVVFANNILCGLYHICRETETFNSKTQNLEPLFSKGTLRSKDSNDSYGLENITLVPNPTTGELRVKSLELQIDEIEIYDICGKKISTHLTNSSTNPCINISHLNSGIYFAKIKTEAGEIIKKVIKN